MRWKGLKQSANLRVAESARMKSRVGMAFLYTPTTNTEALQIESWMPEERQKSLKAFRRAGGIDPQMSETRYDQSWEIRNEPIFEKERPRIQLTQNRDKNDWDIGRGFVTCWYRFATFASRILDHQPVAVEVKGDRITRFLSEIEFGTMKARRTYESWERATRLKGYWSISWRDIQAARDFWQK